MGSKDSTPNLRKDLGEWTPDRSRSIGTAEYFRKDRAYWLHHHKRTQKGCKCGWTGDTESFCTHILDVRRAWWMERL